MIRTIIALVALVSSIFFAAAANEPGGQGFLDRDSEMDRLQSGERCFDSKTGAVALVCTKYRINWKLWSLMGEPVGDYNLAWTLTRIKLRDPTGSSIEYNDINALPSQLQKAVRAIELYIEGVAYIDSVGSTYDTYAARHAFNTGTAVRSDAGSSMNVPGSPSWDTLFFKGEECNEREYSYVSASSAKLIFKQGVKLRWLRICPKSSLSGLGGVDSAIIEFCKIPNSNKTSTHRLCPKQIEKPKPTIAASAIDDAFAQLEQATGKTPSVKTGNIDQEFRKIEAHHIEQERLRIAAIKERQDRADRELAQTRRREEAVQFCTAALKSEQSCLKDACGLEPSKEICTERVENPHPPCTGGSEGRTVRCLVFPTYTCKASVINPAYPVWQSCTRNTASQCLRNGKQPASLNECVAERVK